MNIDVEAIGATPAERSYIIEIQRRVRSGRRQVLTRVAGIQTIWVLVLISGAAISVVQVAELQPWVAGVLGFAVVVFQGAEQLLGRTAKGFTPLDTLRRALDAELRMLALSADSEHDDHERPFARFVERCEALIASYDEADIAYYHSLTGPSSTRR